MRLITIFFLTLIFFLQAKGQCTLNNSSAVSSGYISSTGDSTLDAFIFSEKLKLEKFFNVTVDLKIYEGSNGLAKRTKINSNSNGTIELGKSLLIFEYNKK
jgi:hypothetical protein